MLANVRRSSDLALPLPWEPLNEAQGARYLPVWRDAANSSRSLMIMGLPGEEVGVRQKIYLSVQRELSYTGSIWFKHVRGPSKVTVSLHAHAQAANVLASVDLDAASAVWTKYPFQIQLKQSQLAPLEPVDFVISVHDDSRVLIDEASLMAPNPLTFCRRLKWTELSTRGQASASAFVICCARRLFQLLRPRRRPEPRQPPRRSLRRQDRRLRVRLLRPRWLLLRRQR